MTGIPLLPFPLKIKNRVNQYGGSWGQNHSIFWHSTADSSRHIGQIRLCTQRMWTCSRLPTTDFLLISAPFMENNRICLIVFCSFGIDDSQTEAGSIPKRKIDVAEEERAAPSDQKCNAFCPKTPSVANDQNLKNYNLLVIAYNFSFYGS